MNSIYFHRDCRNYAPIDAAKGICHLTKIDVAGDACCCSSFNRIQKCKYCISYNCDIENADIGVCLSSDNNPKFMAYADMIAITCEKFKEKDIK